ncbi:MAG: hypothetical protein C4554_03860 [Dethiobacter sp.]|nr:MAG: hypothetical protein C4554_03860 [Dethiobacter sp.]
MNLEYEAAKTAHYIVKECEQGGISSREVENVITKTLGVLQENGIYGCIIYLYSLSDDKESNNIIISKLLQMLKLLGVETPVNVNDYENVLKFIIDNVCNDLEKLLMLKQLWEQTLVYARYASKARK